LIDLQKVQDAKHIVLKCQSSSFAHADALYSFLLSLEKRVSLVTQSEIDRRLSFLPWFKKVRTNLPSSAEYIVEVEADVVGVREFFKRVNFKLNKKIATSLYSALLIEFENFQSSRCDGITFALAAELIESGAEYRVADTMINKREPLALFRLRGQLFLTMRVHNSAKSASLFISDEILEATGASLEDAYLVMKETLKLVHLQSVELRDSENKIIKLIKDV